jgi:hypothetical protein
MHCGRGRSRVGSGELFRYSFFRTVTHVSLHGPVWQRQDTDEPGAHLRLSSESESGRTRQVVVAFAVEE